MKKKPPAGLVVAGEIRVPIICDHFSDAHFGAYVRTEKARARFRQPRRLNPHLRVLH